MTNDRTYIPFSQRSGLAETPPQLKLGEASDQLRLLLSYYMTIEIAKFSRFGSDRRYFDDKWRRVATDFYVLFLQKSHSEFDGSSFSFETMISRGFKTSTFGALFDMVEFFYRHPNCSAELKADFQSAFVTARAAYRILDGQIVAIGSDEQGVAFERAILDTEAKGVVSARTHLIAAGSALRNGDWAGSVRESIHAVESMAVQLAPDADADTLGTALKALEKKGHLHGGLKAAFGALYGYSSDEEGIRHALVLKGAARVDETDALFMLGACASFVSYLLARDI